MIALVVLCACAPRYLHSELTPGAALPPSAKIAVLTLVPAGDPKSDAYRTGQIGLGAETMVTERLYQALQQQTPYELTPRLLVEQELARFAGPPSSFTELQALARALKADAVLRGVITDFREREGSHVGVQRPAAVGIELWLTRARDGQTIWHGSYHETQQSLTEEIRTLPLYFKRGTRWLTAEELAAYAVDELIKTLPRPQPADAPAQ